jgi:hypothetical protein
MRASMAFGKREWIKTLSDIDASCRIAKMKGGTGCPVPPLVNLKRPATPG